jgi:predicted SAM-dependent methyltransferase
MQLDFIQDICGKIKRFVIPANNGDVNTRRTKLLAQLSGEGIEIGALHRPVIAPHLKVSYVDRLSVADLRLQYPELAKENLVEPNYLDDAETLATIPDNSQDFVIANHVIEHMANPIGALLAWQRVLKSGGLLFLAAPDKHSTFDKEREITDISHLIEDYNYPSKDRDYQAFLDFSKYVSCRTFKVRPEEEYEQLAQELFDKNYSIHYHVWDFRSFNNFLSYLSNEWKDWNMEVIDSSPTEGQEFIFLLKKK